MEVFNIEFNQLKDEVSAQLGEFVEKTPRLREINFSSNEFTDEANQHLVECIKAAPIEVANFSRNTFANKIPRALFQQLKTASFLRELYLNRNKIDDEGMGTLIDGMKENKSL